MGWSPTVKNIQTITKTLREEHKSKSLAINSKTADEKLGDGTLAEAILDRIIHNSYDIFIDGELSMKEMFGIKAIE